MSNPTKPPTRLLRVEISCNRPGQHPESSTYEVNMPEEMAMKHYHALSKAVDDAWQAERDLWNTPQGVPET